MAHPHPNYTGVSPPPLRFPHLNRQVVIQVELSRVAFLWDEKFFCEMGRLLWDGSSFADHVYWTWLIRMCSKTEEKLFYCFSKLQNNSKTFGERGALGLVGLFPKTIAAHPFLKQICDDEHCYITYYSSSSVVSDNFTRLCSHWCASPWPSPRVVLLQLIMTL